MSDFAGNPTSSRGDEIARPSAEEQLAIRARATAFHEAAHAVAHLRLRLPGKLQWISLEDDAVPAGHTEIERPRECDPTSDRAFDCITQQLVGAQAEFKITGEWPTALSGAADDYRDAKAYARCFGLIPTKTDPPPKMWEAWQEQAGQFTTEHWRAITRIAEALLAKPTQDGKKILDERAIRELTAPLLLRMLRQLWNVLAKCIGFTFIHLPGILLMLVGTYFTFEILSKLSEDTTVITNFSFGISATISALSFSCARSIEGASEDKSRFAYAGERFLHAAIMLLTASALKYATILSGLIEAPSVFTDDFVFREHFVAGAATSFVGIIVGVLFFWAFSSAHGGFIVLNRLLWRRLNRYPDWDNFF